MLLKTEHQYTFVYIMNFSIFIIHPLPLCPPSIPPPDLTRMVIYICSFIANATQKWSWIVAQSCLLMVYLLQRAVSQNNQCLKHLANNELFMSDSKYVLVFWPCLDIPFEKRNDLVNKVSLYNKSTIFVTLKKFVWFFFIYFIKILIWSLI